MHSPTADFVSKTLQGHRKQTASALCSIGWHALLRRKPDAFFLRNRKASHLQLLGLMWNPQRSLWTQCWKVLAVPASNRAWAHYFSRATGLEAERASASDHLCLTLSLVPTACAENNTQKESKRALQRKSILNLMHSDGRWRWSFALNDSPIRWEWTLKCIQWVWQRKRGKDLSTHTHFISLRLILRCHLCVRAGLCVGREQFSDIAQEEKGRGEDIGVNTIMCPSRLCLRPVEFFIIKTGFVHLQMILAVTRFM